MRSSGPSRFVLALGAACLLVLAGCAGSRPQPAERAGHPGFDLWRYPGDDAMQAWRDASPYEWVGIYLPAPCHRDSSWVGTRDRIERMGWGTAVLYVGQQVFEGTPDADPEDGPILCSRTLLTEAQGRTDARDAIARTAAEGFPPGSTIFLDIERADRLPATMRDYFRAWQAEVLADGRYVPGTYAHRLNAVELFAAALAVFREAGRTDAPAFWVAGGSGFSLGAAPREVGFGFATVWQGVLDTDRTWGGVTLNVDENVAVRPSPSAPAPAGTE